MSEIQVGDKVKHPKMTGWGLGKVLEVLAGGKVRVFFINEGEKLLGLKHVALEKVEGAEAYHPILDNPTFSERAGKSKKHKSLPEARFEFLEIFSDGFEDVAYIDVERAYKVDARELFLNLLSKEELSKLLGLGEAEEIVRRALQVANKTNLIFPNEKMALKDGLKQAESAQAFSQALFDLLYAEGEYRVRFEEFAECLGKINAAKWPIMTYFPFLASPEEHMFLKPEITKHAAELTKAELNYKPELNWLTYSCLLEFSKYLHAELIKMEMSPRDMIDVQSFMWCITPGKYEMVEGGAFTPTSGKYKKALRQMMTDGHFENTQYRTMLKAQYEAKNHSITATQLAEAAGYANYNAANLQYGTLGKLMGHNLGFLPPKRQNGERMWWCTLSNGNDSDSNPDGHFEFVMRKELAEALEKLGWV